MPYRLLIAFLALTSLGCFGRQGLLPLCSRPLAAIRPQPTRTQPLAIPAPARAPQSPPASPGDSASESVPNTPEAIRALFAERWKEIDAFEARLTRREVIGSAEPPTEMMHVRFRKQPFSIRFKWLGEEGKGREMVYVKGQYNDELHILTAPGDIPLVRRPSRMSFSPDSPMVRGRSRRHIREGGFDSALECLDKCIPRGSSGVRMLGLTKRPEYPYPLVGVELFVAPGDEKALPKGGERVMYFDPRNSSTSYGLPVVVITHDESGQEVEYYCFDRMLHPVTFDESDFHPDNLGK